MSSRVSAANRGTRFFFCTCLSHVSPQHAVIPSERSESRDLLFFAAAFPTSPPNTLSSRVSAASRGTCFFLPLPLPRLPPPRCHPERAQRIEGPAFSPFPRRFMGSSWTHFQQVTDEMTPFNASIHRSRRFLHSFSSRRDEQKIAQGGNPGFPRPNQLVRPGGSQRTLPESPISSRT